MHIRYGCHTLEDYRGIIICKPVISLFTLTIDDDYRKFQTLLGLTDDNNSLQTRNPFPEMNAYERMMSQSLILFTKWKSDKKLVIWWGV
jgi:hypothetical protein